MATLRQLKTFIAVADYKKMSEAAKMLYISQPTVSQIIADLETEYDTLLFERSPKSLKITPAGTLLLNNARKIVAIHEDLERSMKNINALRPLRIGATLTIGNTMIATLVETLMKQYPDIDVSVFIDNTEVIEHRLIHNELDLALAEGIILREEILTEPAIDDFLYLVCGKQHPFASQAKVTIDELQNQNFIMREKGSGTRAFFENLMLTHHIPFQVKWESSSSTAIIDAVRHNLGLAVLSERCVSEYAKAGELFICPIELFPVKRSFYICRNQCQPITSQMQDFITMVKNFS